MEAREVINRLLSNSCSNPMDNDLDSPRRVMTFEGHCNYITIIATITKEYDHELGYAEYEVESIKFT